MSIRCRLRRHEAGSKIFWNDGYYVTHCERCGTELIRLMHGKWQTVPKSHKIVWKPKPAHYPDWNRIALLDTPPAAARARPAPAVAPAPPLAPTPGEVRLRIVPNGPAAEESPIPSFREWQRRSASR
jgi:hypothetical protein